MRGTVDYAQIDSKQSSDVDYEESPQSSDGEWHVGRTRSKGSRYQTCNNGRNDTKPLESILKSSIPKELQQVLFKTYNREIKLYHYAANVLPARDYIKTLTYFPLGYEYSLLNEDPTREFPVGEGDEVPDGCIEVAYLPRIFKPNGCAIGFRYAEENSIEWLCFNCPMDHVLDKAHGPRGVTLFDFVATLDTGRTTKMQKGIGGHAEYKAWYDSVRYGTRKPLRLKLMLKEPAEKKSKGIEGAKQVLGEIDPKSHSLGKSELNISLARKGTSAVKTYSIPGPQRPRVRFQADLDRIG